VALHLVSGAGQRFSTWNHSSGSETVAYRDIEDVIATALEAELGPDQQLAARLTAGSLVAALDTVERTAEARMQEGDTLPPAEVEHLVELAVAFVTAGIAGVSDRNRP